MLPTGAAPHLVEAMGAGAAHLREATLWEAQRIPRLRVAQRIPLDQESPRIPRLRMAQRMPLDQRIPRLRMAHLALPPAEDAMEGQQHRILKVPSLPGKDYDYIHEREAMFLPSADCELTGVLLPIQSSPVCFWLV